ncbi:MAG: hypothetical protein KJ970_07845 [Candidatus Eisenbacteria bacterium]|uniref:DUF1579 domain-containing protein n=1 Tax=Eiseniibacteriota bacterium TaxID=2212470 RepID=A0A948RTP6_UNCEI|nr:hypothetical protein [Candidatus Eisenbacteria bacterium]MBU1949884.1 hypothetical protein [Candidatus Eisenbacteria bacterium]MBU2690828.1 hypothetical protein [Candidatus Eisenbacteria bacterium]
MHNRRSALFFGLWTLVLLLPLAGARAADNANNEFGTLDPSAPPETAQFDFLVGSWRVEIASKDVEGGDLIIHVDWTIEYILGGWALQDSWKVYDDKGRVYNYGTMFRYFNIEHKTWMIVEQVTPDLNFIYMTAKQEGDRMVMWRPTEENLDLMAGQAGKSCG